MFLRGLEILQPHKSIDLRVCIDYFIRAFMALYFI